LLRPAGIEHRVLKAGVHRLKASGGHPGPSIFSAFLADQERNGEILGVATILPSDQDRQNATGSGCR